MVKKGIDCASLLSMPPVDQIRRCEILFFEPREVVRFALEGLLAGGNGLLREQHWVALAPHLAEPTMVSAAERELLGTLSPVQWTEHALDEPLLRGLVERGLVITRQCLDATLIEHRQRDEAIRQSYWHPLNAVMHAFTRWEGVDAVKNTEDAGVGTATGMLDVLGPPPIHQAVEPAGSTIDLPAPERTALDDLLARRATCRNFDSARPLTLEVFTQVLHRTFGAQAVVDVSDELSFEKRNSPSGGGLHPCHAYLVVQNVEGIPAGLYRYHGIRNQLMPLPAPGGDLHAFSMQCVAQQHWFADAHCLVLTVADFDRTFWKYRRHAKGYRVVALEAGHLSQMLYLAATECGAAAFITGAINERSIEQALGLDSSRQGVLAVSGFGWRGPSMQTAELDPRQSVWQRVD